MEIRLSSTISLLLIQVSLRPKLRPPKKTNAITKIIEEVTQSLGSTPPRLQKKIRIRTRTWAISNVIPINKNATMLTSILKSQKTSDSFGNFYVNNKKENKEVGTSTLYFVSRDFQRSNKSTSKFKKRS